ncbi:beta-glucuronidase [Termitidicoccus mucosus]|uniref:Beta-glucuronidase n=1 Tax=Termitidicoccus mucosus TaxID=1184151 RepID=A0A178IE19_9BACT|nr:beta-glucuronidase [Opitutaceae bacterium TSB47]
MISFRFVWFSLVFLTGTASATAMSDAIPNVYAQTRLSLNGKWRVIVDPYDTGFYNYRRIPYDQSDPIKGGYALDLKARTPSDLVEYNFSTSQTLLVPRDWNTQDDKLFYYEGSVWYQREFSYRPTSPDSRLFVYFGAANYRADVYLNGRRLGTHIGGFTPFNFEITGRLKDGPNSLVVRVNNTRLKEGVPTDSTDWWNYGGLTRDVFVVEMPATYVATHDIQLARGVPDRIAISIRLDGSAASSTPVTVSIPGLAFEARLTPGADGAARGEFPVAAGKLRRWSPESPKLYDVTIAAGDALVTERIGFRTVETRGPDILLNGEPVFLRGISIHEENPLRGGRAWSEEDARLLLGWARELGCNFARLAHYPHNEHMARVADELGIMLWEEIPVYWTIQWENPDTLANARRQLAELVHRDRNRASVIIWSVANETPVNDARTRFLGTLVADVRALDPTRLVSAAMEPHHEEHAPDTRIIDDPLGALTDIISFNQYIGWYDGLPEKCDRIRWDIRYDKPVFISEFGGGALEGFHAAPDVRYSEEFQEELYRRTLPMLERIPAWRGATPWILADFRSPRRPLPGIKDGWNRKGLIGESGAKKKAWFVLRDYYEKKAGE